MKVCIILALVLTLLGCAKQTTDTALLVAGKSLATLGEQFVALGKVHVAHCVFDKVKPEVQNPQAFVTFCREFYNFAPKFGQAYTPAVQTWRAAVAANDAAQVAGAQAVILQLSTDLAAIAAGVLSSL